MSNIIDAGDMLVVETVCTVPGQVSINRLHWKVLATSGTVGVKFIDVASWWNGLVANTYKSLMFNGAQYYGVRCRRVFPANTDRWQFVNASAGPGLAGAIGLPTQTCGLISLTGSVLGRKGAGRQYLPFPAADDNDGAGVPLGGYITKAAALAIQLVTQQTVPSNPAGGEAIIRCNVAPEVGIPEGNAVTEAIPRTAWATQRRRGSFGRLNNLPF